jgi:adenylate kinase family enzyme
MPEFPPLSALGPRIMICGPSNAGKSTLCVALAARLGDTPAIHLDRFRFLPGTDWAERPDADFADLHDAAIAGERWVMDGNYSKLMPQRLSRATGVVLCGDDRWANLMRYFGRTLFQKDRAGALEGGTERLKWAMVRWILVASPKNLRRYRETLPKAGLPLVETRSMAALKRLYAEWGLGR